MPPTSDQMCSALLYVYIATFESKIIKSKLFVYYMQISRIVIKNSFRFKVGEATGCFHFVLH